MSIDLTYAWKLDNYAIDATGGGLWLTTTQYRVTVPAGKRWFFTGGHCLRNVSSIMTVYIKNSSDEILLNPSYHAAATGATPFPLSTYTGMNIFPYVMDAGDYLVIVFGTAQDAGSYASAHMLEVDV